MPIGNAAQNGDWFKDYDVGPDGRILGLMGGFGEYGDDRGQVVVVQGWADEVARRVEAGQ